MKRTITAVITIIVGSAALALSLLAQSKASEVKPANTPEVITDISDAWVRLYEDRSFQGKVLTVKGETDIKNLDNVKSDDGKKGFGDKTSSVKFQIPAGWELVLFDDHDFKNSPYWLKGTGKVVEISDIGAFNDKTSSVRWEQIPGGPQ